MAKQASNRSTKAPARKAAGRSQSGSQRPGSARRGAVAKKSSAASPAKSAKQLSDLFHETLKDIYHAEKQILKALPKMAKAAQSDALRQAFKTHQAETEGQVDRLEQVFEMLGKRPQAKPCHAILGLVEEGQEVMEDFKGSDALDAGLLAGAQAVEHYEISRYGTLSAWASELGMDDAAELFEATLAEEKHADALLTGLAESDVNQRAEGGAG